MEHGQTVGNLLEGFNAKKLGRSDKYHLLAVRGKHVFFLFFLNVAWREIK